MEYGFGGAAHLGAAWIKRAVIAVLFLFAFVGNAFAINYGDIKVTDVSSKSFTVNWQVAEVSSGDLLVYRDVLGATPAPEAVVLPGFSASNSAELNTLAESNGVMRVRVTGLNANTSYFFRLVTTSHSDSSQTTFPLNGSALPSVKTLSHSKPVNNEGLRVQVLAQDGITLADGSVVVLSVEGDDQYISAMVGDGNTAGEAVLNISNLFDSSTSLRRFVTGGELVNWYVMGGTQGEVSVTGVLPLNELQGELKQAAISSLTLGLNDSDEDGMSDAYELAHGLDPFNSGDALLDSDGDGLSNLQEFELGSDAQSVDSDGDGLEDGEEYAEGTRLTEADSDHDGLTDFEELRGAIVTLALNADSDGDGVNDSLEIQLGSDPNNENDVPVIDIDGDTIPDINDNCPDFANTDQRDNDADGYGDLCDSDDDNDGVPDTIDNAPLTPNADQLDEDNDLIGDVADNCLGLSNQAQLDNDGDGQGDLCDEDDDNDSINDLAPQPEASEASFYVSQIHEVVSSTVLSSSSTTAGIGIAKWVLGEANPILMGVFDLRTRVYTPETLTAEQQAAQGTLYIGLDVYNCDCFGPILRDGDTITIDTDQGRITAFLSTTPLLPGSSNNSLLVSLDGSTFSARYNDDSGRLAVLLFNANRREKLDNCQFDANPGQEDFDNDGIGDACDFTEDDLDGDNIANELDNCPTAHNVDQLDFDLDGQGDACDQDDDNDGLSDEDELALFSNPLNADSDGDGIFDGDEDFDLDGISNAQELAQGLDPFNTSIQLYAGLNYFSFPEASAPSVTAFELMNILGGMGFVESIERFNPLLQTYELASYVDGVPSGDDFVLRVNEGYRVNMLASNFIEFDGYPTCAMVSLEAGFNLVGFQCVANGTTAFDLLGELGEASVQSIRRFNAELGVYEQASFIGSNYQGVDFLIKRGEAYEITMIDSSVIVSSAMVGSVIEVESHNEGDLIYSNELHVVGRIGNGRDQVWVNGVAANVQAAQSGYEFSADITLEQGFQQIQVIARTPENIVTTLQFSVLVGSLTTEGDASDNVMFGTEEGEYFYPRGGNNVVFGFGGNDNVRSDTGALDRIYGGTGDDTFNGGRYFHFSEGDGNDTLRLRNQSSIADIYFDETVDPDTIVIERRYSTDITIYYGNAGDSIIYRDFFWGSSQSLKSINFAGKGYLNEQQIRDLLLIGNEFGDDIASTPFDDVIDGRGGYDTFSLDGVGNDTVYGGAGEDQYEIFATTTDLGRLILIPGPDDDYIWFENAIEGQSTEDGYSVNLDFDVDIQLSPGDGSDTVVNLHHVKNLDITFNGDVKESDLYVELLDDETLQLNYGDGDNVKFETVKINGTITRVSALVQFLSGQVNGRVILGNGDIISLNDILYTYLGSASTSYDDVAILSPGETLLDGGSGFDFLSGGFGDDELIGGVGEDVLFDSVGNDTFDAGVGNDTIYINDGNNIIRFQEGYGEETIYVSGGEARIVVDANISPSTVSVTNDRRILQMYPVTHNPSEFNDLVITLNNEGDRLRIRDYWGPMQGEYWPNSIKNVSVEFLSDGTVWYHDDFMSRLNQATNGDDYFILGGLDQDTVLGEYEFDGGPGDDTFVAYSGGGNTFYYSANSGNDVFSFMARREHWDYAKFPEGSDYSKPQYGGEFIDGISVNNTLIFSGISYSQADFYLESDDLVVVINGDSNQSVRIGDAFSLLTLSNADSEIFSTFQFSDITVTFSDIKNYLENSVTNGNEIFDVDCLQGTEVGSQYDDLFLIDYVNDGSCYSGSEDVVDLVIEPGTGDDLIWFKSVYGRQRATRIVIRPGDGIDTIELHESYVGVKQDIELEFLNEDGSPIRDLLYVYNPMKYGAGFEAIEYDGGAVLFRTGGHISKITNSTLNVSFVELRQYYGMSVYGVSKEFASDNRANNDSFKVYPSREEKQFYVLEGTEISSNGNGDDVFYGGSASERINARRGSNIIYGGGGDDLIFGGLLSDVIYGGAGNDFIYTGDVTGSFGCGAGSKVEGGFGNDSIYLGSGGSSGATMGYCGAEISFSPGDGNDVIYLSNRALSSSATFALRLFFEEVQLSDLEFEQKGKNLLVKYTDSDSVLIDNYFLTSFVGERLERDRLEIGFLFPSVGGMTHSVTFLERENTRPVSGDDVYEAVIGLPFSVRIEELLLNDTDSDGDQLFIYEIVDSESGSAEIDQETGVITFTPDAYLTGEASFEYRVDDNFGGYDTATVTINFASSSALLIGSSYSDNLDGTESADYLMGEAGNDVLHGLDGNDTLIGGSGEDQLFGGAGDDVIYYSRGDVVDGGSGFDTVYGLDILLNSASDDEFYLPHIADVEYINGGRGENILIGSESPDYFDLTFNLYVNISYIDLKGGDDVLFAPDLSPLPVYGNTGNDTLYGGVNADQLFGEVGSDRLFGNGGSDELSGGLDSDIVVGGQGSDVYYWTPGDGNEFISDYNVEDAGNYLHKDRLVIGDALVGDHFRALASGDFTWSRTEFNDLLMTYNLSGETIKLFNWFNDYDNKLNEITLSDELSIQEIEQIANQNIINYPTLSVPSGGSVAEGQGVYEGQCLSCHGVEASGIGSFGESLIQISGEAVTQSLDNLFHYVSYQMPAGDEQSCEGVCAKSVAMYLQTLSLPMDSDNDGVSDEFDLCDASAYDDIVNSSGCAPYQLDDDGDGVPNALDLCPNTPEGEIVDATGCVLPQVDSDNDGVIDAFDLCPNTTLGDAVNVNGCSNEQLRVPSSDYQASSNSGGPGSDGCIGAGNCTVETWGVDLNGDTGFRWIVDGGLVGGGADIYVRVSTPSGTRSMSLWVNDSHVDTITTDTNQSPRPNGSEFGPFAVEMLAGSNTVELRDTENSAEFDVYNLRIVGHEFVGDFDNDGVPDNLDLCPNTPASDAVDENGCAQSQLDSDNDGVSDADDVCPNTPQGTFVDPSGCENVNRISSDATFSGGQQSFETYIADGVQASFVFTNSEVEIQIESILATPEDWDIQLAHDVSISETGSYVVCFDALAETENRNVSVMIDSGSPDNASIVEARSHQTLSTEYQRFTSTFNVLIVDETARVSVDVGREVSNVSLDNIGVYRGTVCPPAPEEDNVPVVTIESPSDSSSFAEGAEVQFIATAADVEDGNLDSLISWSSDIDGELSTGASFSTSSLSNGVHLISASIMDSAMQTAVDTITISITVPDNQSPIIPELPDITSTINSEVVFDGSSAFDNDGSIVSYMWESSAFTSPLTGVNPTHTFTSVGDFDVMLTVTDDDGATAQQTLTVSVTDSSGNWQRTVILIYGRTEQGQDMFFRGGLDSNWSNTNRGTSCNPSTGGDHNIPCSIGIRHRNELHEYTRPWRTGDNYLDWGKLTPALNGREAEQTGTNDKGEQAVGTPAIWTTNNCASGNIYSEDDLAHSCNASPNLYGGGFTNMNTYGDHYWILDVDMNCDDTIDGWFEFKSYISNGPGWEGAINQTNFFGLTPPSYQSGNHFAQCGMVNVFRRDVNNPDDIKDF